MNRFTTKLIGGDLRSIGKSNEVVGNVKSQKDFDLLFLGLFNPDRKVVMRAADAIEKITSMNGKFLFRHKKKILVLCSNAVNKELKWHLALIVPRLDLSKKEFENTWEILMKWAKDQKESKIVRVNAIQGLFNLTKQNNASLSSFNETLIQIGKENIPSLNARIKILQNSGCNQ